MMKKGKSLSDWMSCALVEPPPDHTHDHTSSRPPATTRKASSRKVTRGGHRNDSAPSEASVADEDVPWVAKYQPQTTVELAVHKKKIAEVQQWLEFALSARCCHPMLLLSGPPGCGKTATLHALAKEMGFSVLEWVNPITHVGGPMQEGYHPGDQILSLESQSKQFQNFIIRANRYPSLLIGGVADGGRASAAKKKVVLVEEFPNAFLRDPSKFYQVLRVVQNSLHYPLVFIVSESHQSGANSSSIFRKEHMNIDLHTISFNPVAHTSLVKTLVKIASAECQHGSGKGTSSRSWDRLKLFMPPREVLEGLAGSSCGDIRSAINSLQFICLKISALTYLSDADILSQMWSDSPALRLMLQGYSSSVACRGLIHSNRSSAVGKWRPLHKPQWNTVIKQHQESCASARSLFLHLGTSPYAHLWSPIELQTQILPYMAVINTRLRNPDQVSLLLSITHFKSGNCRYQQCLGEKDIEPDLRTPAHQQSVDARMGTIMGASSQHSGGPLSQNIRMTSDGDQDDEIGDFDDDDDDHGGGLW